jgi:hypothetical protein
MVHTKSRQSARLSLQSSELAPSPPQPQFSVAPPFGSKSGTHSLGGEGVGDKHSVTLG